MLTEIGLKNIEELKITCKAVLRDIDLAVENKDWERLERMSNALKFISQSVQLSTHNAKKRGV